MTKSIALFVILMLLFVIQAKTANSQTDITNSDALMQTIQGNLAYIDATKPNNVYTQPIIFDPPDGISKIMSIEIILQGDFQANTIVSAKIGEAYCEPSRWITPRYDVAGYRITFDCTFLGIEKTKDIQFNFVTDIEAKNLKGWYKISYYNDWKLPDEIAGKILKPTLTMHGTEYDIGTFGKVWLHLLDSNGVAVNNGTCYLDVYYPHGLVFINKAVMMFMSDGIYQYDLMIPNIVGVYPAVATCYYTTTALTETADAGSIINGTNAAGSYTATLTSNNVYWSIDEASINATYRVAFIENFTNIIQPSQLTGVTIEWEGRWNGGTDSLTIYIKNFTTNAWVALPNTIDDTGAADAIITNSIDTTNATKSGILSSTNESRIMISDSNDADAVLSRARTDYLALNFIYRTGVVRTEIRGSSEIHATSKRATNYVIIYDDCGEIVAGSAGECGNFVDYDNSTNYMENEIEVNLTIQSIAAEDGLETSWEYWTPISLDCTSVYWIQYLNGTTWQDVTSQAQMDGELGNENCHITMPIIVDIGGTYQYRLLMDNYMKWEIEWAKNVRDITYNMIYSGCSYYAYLNNYTYIAPILKDTFVNNTDIELGGCHRYFDDIYWFDNFYNLSQNVTNVAEYTSYYLELRWYETALRQHNQIYSSIVLTEFYAAERAKNMTIDNIWNYANRSVYLETFNLKYVGGTEYNTNDTVQVSTQFLRSAGANLIPVNDAQCNVTVYYPNRSIFLSNMNATLISGSNAIYSYNLIAPATEGIYHADFRCNKPAPSASTVYSSGTFHIAPWANHIYSINPLINSVNSSLYFLIYNVNNSIYMRIDQINDSITNKIDDVRIKVEEIDSSLTQMNISIMDKLYSMHGELQNISGDIADVMLLIGDVNQTLYDRLIIIQNDINSMSSQIDAVNSTVMNKLYKMQDEITSVNDSVKESNLSIMTKLYSMQTELAAINASIITTILLLSNTSFNITISQQDLFDSLVALWGDSMAKPTYGGMTGFFLPSAEAAEDSQYTCIDNMTMRRVTNIFLNSSGVPKNYDKVVDVPCTYGCRNNVCIQPDYTIFILLLLVVIGLYVLYRIFTRT